MNPTISIVMPAYNSAKYIEKAIQSVLEQTFTDFELLICDDGSVDDTRNIVERYSSLDERVILVNNKYLKGAAGARNTCLDLSKGEFIAFLDSDDYWEKDKLLVQYNYMVSNSIDFSYSDYYMFSEKNTTVVECKSHNIFDNLTYTCDIGCLTVMVRKSYVGNLRFPYLPKEDYAFWLLILKQGGKAYNINYISSFYRKSSGSLSSNKFKEAFKQYNVLRKMTNYSQMKILFRMSTYIYYAIMKHYIK